MVGPFRVRLDGTRCAVIWGARATTARTRVQIASDNMSSHDHELPSKESRNAAGWSCR